MRITEAKIKMNQETFVPEIHVTYVIPVEPLQDANALGGEAESRETGYKMIQLLDEYLTNNTMY